MKNLIKLTWRRFGSSNSRLFTLDDILKESRSLDRIRKLGDRILEYDTDVVYEGMQLECIEAGTLLTDYYARVISFVTNIERKKKLEAL